MKKIDLSNKKTNYIVSGIILGLVLILGVLTSVTFISFYKYKAQFSVDADTVEVQKLSKYSPSLEGTINDTEIYVKHGSNNTVALVKEEVSSLEELKTKTICASISQYATADEASLELTISECSAQASDDNQAITALKNNECGAAIVSYLSAYNAIKEDSSLIISSLEIERVPSMLIIGGTHPNEPSGQLSATIYLESAVVERGTLYIITELNRSAYSYSQPQEGTIMYYTIDIYDNSGNKIGERTFKYGSRLTNVVNQWPVPDVYTHLSGQQLSANEVRNLNRSYPGSVNGSYTERIAYGVTQCILANDITMVVDLHEASPEYMTNNACVYHQDTGVLETKLERNIKKATNDMSIKYDPSSQDLHGLTHRELGDYTNAYCFLFETSCAAIGRIHGKVSESLVTYTEGDKFYEYLNKLDIENEANYLKELEEYQAKIASGDTTAVEPTQPTKYLEATPVSIDERVARHVTSIASLIKAFNSIKKERTSYECSKLDESERHTEEKCYLGLLNVSGIPGYEDVINNHVGSYLKVINN